MPNNETRPIPNLTSPASKIDPEAETAILENQPPKSNQPETPNQETA